MANQGVKGHAISLTEAPESLRRKLQTLQARFVGSIRQTKDVDDAYTLLETDSGSLILFTVGTDEDITVPVSLPEGWWCDLVQLGAGTATFVPASGASVDSLTGTEETGGQYARVRVEVVGNSDGVSAAAVVSGDLAPAP